MSPQESPRASDERLNEHIILLEPFELFGTLDYDLNATTAMDAWVYSVDATFFKTLFGPVLGQIPVRIVCDHAHTTPWRDLVDEFKLLTVKTWAQNRTMHDKTIVLHGRRLVYLMTQNLHRGSFMLSLNRCARVTTETFYQTITFRFADDFARSRPLPARQTRP